MIKKLLIATTNPAKLAEFKKLLKDLPFALVSLSDIGISDDIEETGKTFEENAMLKATFYFQKSGIPTLADDGGVEIDALGGSPGVHSRRWAGSENNLVHDQASDDRIINFCLAQMNDVPQKDRGAQMKTVVVFIDAHGNAHIGTGIVRGIIAEKADEHRMTGFPFRALFYLPEIQKYYSDAYLTDEEIEKYSHRKKALAHILPKFA